MWYLKQLLPMRYKTTYRENGVRKRCVWWMWLGRAFAIRESVLPADA